MNIDKNSNPRYFGPIFGSLTAERRGIVGLAPAVKDEEANGELFTDLHSVKPWLVTVVWLSDALTRVLRNYDGHDGLDQGSWDTRLLVHVSKSSWFMTMPAQWPWYIKRAINRQYDHQR